MITKGRTAWLLGCYAIRTVKSPCTRLVAGRSSGAISSSLSKRAVTVYTRHVPRNWTETVVHNHYHEHNDKYGIAHCGSQKSKQYRKHIAHIDKAIEKQALVACPVR